MLRRHYVPRSEGELVYSSPPTIKTYVPMLLNLLVYIITFALWMYLDSAYYGFGSKIITPLTGAMWVVGAVFALILPSQREEIIRHTKWFILGYVGILFLYRYVNRRYLEPLDTLPLDPAMMEVAVEEAASEPLEEPLA